jgi:PKD repeat protein
MKSFSMSNSAVCRRSAILATALLFLGFSGFSQILTFDFAGAAGNEATYPSNFNDALLSASSISRSSAMVPTANADRFNSIMWTTSPALDSNRYLEFTITPLPGKQFSISQVIVKYQRSNRGPHKLVVRTSADGFTNNMGGVMNLPDNTLPTTKVFNFSIVDQQTPLVVRLYGYQAEYWSTSDFGPGDNLGDDIVVNGSTEAIPTSVQFVNTASAVSEDGGPIDLALSIDHPDPAVPTSVTISAADPNGRITSFSSPVVFPAGSSSDEATTVVLNDNTLCDGDEGIVFTITSVTGGPGAETGDNAAYTLTVIDNNDVLQVPVATEPTTINSNDFIATWNVDGGATGYYLDVSTSPTFGGAEQLVTWTFPSTSADSVADGGLPVNQDRIITTTSDGTTNYPTGASGTPDRAIQTNDWSNGSGAKWWQIDLNTSNYFGLTLSSAQRSSNTGPRDFKVQYRIGPEGTWTDVPGSAVTVANNFTSGALNALPLPSACDDQPQLFLRWIMTSNTRVNGTFPITPGGLSMIDNISVDASSSSAYVAGYENLDVGNVTSYAVTGLSPGTDYYYRIRAEGTGCGISINSNVIHVTTLGADIYYSRGSGNVTDAIWSDTPDGPNGPALWSANSSMVVQNGHTVTITFNITTVKDLRVDAGGTLVLNGTAEVAVNGDTASFDGALVADDASTLAMASSSASFLESSGGPLDVGILYLGTPTGTSTDAVINIHNTLQIDAGNFDASAGTVTLVSTPSGTGRLGKMVAGTGYIGDLTVQRYIPAGATNWRMLGSPVAGQTIANWNDDFVTAGFPGADVPDFYSPLGSTTLWPSIRWYNEPDPDASLDSSLVSVSGASQPLVPGQGFFTWSGTSLSSTIAFTVNVTGAPNIAQTPITLPMSYTDTGHPTDDGLNMVSNPLPSPIDFGKIERGDDVANTYWIFDPSTGNTLSWSNNVGQGNLNGHLQSSQGFWLQATGPSVTTTVDESAKLNAPTDGAVFGGDQQPDLPVLHLALTSNVNSFRDEATVVFAQGGPALNPKDATKLVFGSPGAPQLSVLSSDGHDLAIDFFGNYSGAITIPVKARAAVSGTYTITANMVGIQSLSCMTLEDLVTGSITPLTDGAAYSFTLDPADDGETPRFLLHASAPLPLLLDEPVCGGNPGQATVTVNNGPLNINWTDAFGNTLLQQMDVNGNAVFSNIPAGNYAVHVTPGGACGELVADFSITAPPAVEAAVENTTPATCPNSSDGLVDLIALGGTAPYTYTWSNGSTGEDLVASPGSYSVTVTDSLGCTGTTTAIITGAAGTVAGFTTSGTEALIGQPVSFTNTTELGNTWDWNFGDGTGSTSMDPVHAWTASGTYTVTLTATGGDCSDQTSTDIHVASATGIADNAGQSGNLSVWADPNSIMIDHTFGRQPVQVDVYDATGRLALSRSDIVSAGRITIADQQLDAGIWFVHVTSGNVEGTFRVPLIR